MASQNKGNSFDLALSIVRNSHLKYPDKAILDSFLTDAVDVELASQYFLQRCYEKSHHIATLDKFVAEWKVVVTKCKCLRWNPSIRYIFSADMEVS